MGWRLPVWVEPYLAEVGVQWPDADEAAMLRAGLAWAAAGDSVSERHREASLELRDLHAANTGPGIDQAALFEARLVSGPAAHHDVSRLACMAVAGFHVAAAGVILCTKIQVTARLLEYGAQKLALQAASAGAAPLAAEVESIAITLGTISQALLALVQISEDALGAMTAAAETVIDLFSDVALPLLRARPMDDERDAHQGQPAHVPYGIDQDRDYRSSLLTLDGSPYKGHPEWLPGHPPGRSSQPVLGSSEGGGTWVEIGRGNSGMAYQEYAMNIERDGNRVTELRFDVEGLPLLSREGEVPQKTLDMEGYVPQDDRAEGSPAFYQEAKDGYSFLIGQPTTSGAANAIAQQARNQLTVAQANTPGATVEWHVSDPVGAEAIRRILLDANLEDDVHVFYSPGPR